jgi:hypothetical protein
MRKFVLIGVLCLGAFVIPAAQASSLTIDGHFKESYPKDGSQACVSPTGGTCGPGKLKGYGDATESFMELERLGIDENGCLLILASDTITLADAQQSSFTVIEHDTICNPGNSHGAPGHLVSYGNPTKFAGTWVYATGSGTGVFANACGGSGTDNTIFAGAAAIVDYVGTLTTC